MATGGVAPQDATARASHESSPEKQPNQIPDIEIGALLATLNTLAGDISKEKLKKLKFLSGELIGKRALEDVLDSLDLFQVLIDRGDITANDTSTLQDMLNKAGLHMLSEKLQAFHKSGVPPSGAGDTVTEEEERLVSFLKDTYKGHFALLKPIPWNDDLKLKLKEVYTRLEVKKVERGAIKEGQDLECLHDMFMADEEGQHALRIRIEGAPAMGKSTICRKIAYDWACGELKQYKLLFFLEMRHAQGLAVIDEIFSQLLPKDFPITKEELANIISQKEKSTLFLFDGLDELIKGRIDGCEIADHIAKKLRAYCTIVITTRPRLRDKYVSDCDLHLIVKGFTEASTNEYIDKYFKDDKDTGMTLKQQIKLQREDVIKESITDLLCNPLHVSFLCILWEDYKRNEKENYFPKNHSELYSEVLECTLKRYCAKNNIELDDEIPKLVTDYRDKLAIDSYKVYSADETNFLKTDISCEEYIHLGLLVRDLGHSRIKRKELYFFYHKTWLEFFTAFYISSQLEVGDTTGLDSLFSDPLKSSSVLKFLAGVSESKASGLLFNRFNQEIQTLKNKRNTPKAYIDDSIKLSYALSPCFECLHESKQGPVSLAYVESSIKGILLYGELRSARFKCGELCDSPKHEVNKFITVLRSHCRFSSILHFMKLRPSHIEVLRMYQPSIQEMSILSNTLSDTESNVILKTLEIYLYHMSSRQTVQHVNNWSNVLNNVKAYAALQTLNICIGSVGKHDDTTEELKVSFEKLSAEIADNEKIQNCALKFNSFIFYTCSSQQLFEKFVKGPRTVEFALDGSKCQLSSLCNFMKYCRETESIKLEIGDTYDSDDSNLELNMCLQNISTSIKVLSLRIKELNRGSDLFDTLSTNTTLSEMSIGWITEQAIDKAYDIIKHNKFARSLTFYVCDFIINGEAMVESLRENKALKHLCVHQLYPLRTGYNDKFDVLFVCIAKEIANRQVSLKSIKLSWKSNSQEKFSKAADSISQQLGQHHWSYNVVAHCSGCYMHKLSYCTEDDGISQVE